MKPSSAAILSLALALGACARDQARPTQVAQAGNVPPVTVVGAPTDPTDPFEATNRKILDFNFAMDDAVIKPVAQAYRKAIGPWPRQRIHNVLSNLSEPAVAANRLLQGEPVAAGTSLMRFVINSTLGLGGLFDLASIGGPPRQVGDFGQTLAKWGLPDGPYLMVPFIGPSNPREFVGMIGTGFSNPINYPLPFAANFGRGLTQGLDERERNIETIDDLRTNSLDVYARLRSLWRQHRDAEIGRATAAEPDILEDPGAATPGAVPPQVIAPPATPPPKVRRPPAAHPERHAADARKKAGTRTVATRPATRLASRGG